MTATNGQSPSSAAAAECHYRSGRYGAALGELERSGRRRGGSPLVFVAPRKGDHRDGAPGRGGAGDGADGVITTDPAIEEEEDCGGEGPAGGEITRVELLALPPLAAAADAAMCRLRAAAAGRTGERGEEDASDLLEGALRSNGAYREALRGAAWSLLDRLASCRAVSDGGDEEGTVAAAISSIRRAVGETALAILMAAVSASHLLLRGGQGDEAWGALAGSASFAASALTEAAGDEGEKEDDADGMEGNLAALARLLPAPRGRAALRSLRTALKASALASGRMILVPPPAESSDDGEPPAKRQRTRTPNEGEGSRVGGSVWSPAGIDGDAASDPLASAREHLADGLAYHVASRRLSNTRTALLRERRDACLDAAAEWEGRSRLFDCFGSPSSLRLSQRGRGGTAPKGPRRGGGQAWRVGCCLRLSDGTDPKSVPAGLLASSSFARKLAASDLARRGDHAGALGLLRRCLEDEGGIGSDDGADGEDSDAHTAGCAARCLLAEGGAGAALELMLHLHWRREDRARECEKGGRSDGGPCALLVPVGGGATTISTGTHTREDDAEGGDRVRWDVFAAASLAGEWPTCLSALDGMASGPRRAEAARAFALLQCRRPSDAEGAAAGILGGREGEPRGGPLECVAGLYRADALLQRGGPSDAAAAAECTARALGCLEVRAADDSDDDNATQPSPSSELLAAALCDDGVALLARGDGAGALLSFRRSASLASRLASRLDVRPSFNLALLLLREGRLDGAADAWLAARGRREDWLAALAGGAGRDAALARLRGSREVAANRHGLLLAGRRMAAAAAAASIGELAADRPPTEPGDVGFLVDDWSPPSDGHEDDDDGSAGFAAQATALDVLLLRHAVQVVERRRSAASSSLFRRPG